MYLSCTYKMWFNSRMIEWMADPFIVLQCFRLLIGNYVLEEAVLRGVTGMLISSLFHSLIVSWVWKIHLLLAEVFQGWFFFFFFSSTNEPLVSDLINIFVFWEIIQVTNKLLQEIDLHLYKLHFVQGFCSLFHSQVHGSNLLSLIRLQGVSQKMMIVAIFRTIGTLWLIKQP